MQSIASLLTNKKIIQKKSERPINVNYEEAAEFGKYCGVNTIFVLKLFKKFGKQKVLNLKSWLADLPYDPKKGKAGLIIWKLNQN